MSTDTVDARPCGAEAQVTLHYRGGGAMSKTTTLVWADGQLQNDSTPGVFTLPSRFLSYAPFLLARFVSVKTFLSLINLAFDPAVVQRKG